ncbi:MAG: DNA mismatch endonuclease Vsr [Deltaproteobacteria bacterium]|nr:DNA mismatch endonuclease Vsr [Deltaproteobacteria bacterium]
MADVHTPEQRSHNMAAIRSKDTKPEMLVRRLVHSMGYRYRLHRKDLPGKPDLTFSKLQKVIFVHGCYWHMHNCRYGRVTPKTNTEFWRKKRQSNVERDRKNLKALKVADWDTLVVWECEIKDRHRLMAKLSDFLKNRLCGAG